MCGVTGIFHYHSGARRETNERGGLAMVDALLHRGPDDGGLLIAPQIALGHRRLSILDLSDKGHQPMPDDSGRCWIAYNGEVYNFPELRRELERCGHRFRSRTDTEVILRGYLQWGRDLVHRLNGMFAFALWDRRDDSLWLVRDPIGIKPLFYHDDGETLRFGSEIKAILADPAVGRQPDYKALEGLLTFGTRRRRRRAFKASGNSCPASGSRPIVTESSESGGFAWTTPTSRPDGRPTRLPAVSKRRLTRRSSGRWSAMCRSGPC